MSAKPIVISRDALDAVNAAQMAPREVPTFDTARQVPALAQAACSVRSAFEAWITASPMEKDVSRNSTDHSKSAWPGQYRVYEVQLAWEAWCAAIAGAETVGEYRGLHTQREWWSGGTWLRPGERVAVVSSPNVKDEPRRQ